MCKKLHILSSGGRWFSDESCNSNIGPLKSSILSLDYVLRTLKPGEYWFIPEDDVCSSDSAIFVEKDLKF